MDNFSLVEAVDRFGGGIVITVADTFDRRRQLLPGARSTGRTDIGRRSSLQWAVEPPLTRQANACIRLSGPSRDKQTHCAKSHWPAEPCGYPATEPSSSRPLRVCMNRHPHMNRCGNAGAVQTHRSPHLRRGNSTCSKHMSS